MHLDCRAGFLMFSLHGSYTVSCGFCPGAGKGSVGGVPNHHHKLLAPAPFIHLLGLEAPSKLHTHQQGWKLHHSFTAIMAPSLAGAGGTGSIHNCIYLLRFPFPLVCFSFPI